MNAGSGALAVTVDGPSKVQLNCREVEEGYEFTYTPTAPGDYLITIKYAGNTHIPGSPFKARITGQLILNTIIGFVALLMAVVERGRANKIFYFEMYHCHCFRPR